MLSRTLPIPQSGENLGERDEGQSAPGQKTGTSGSGNGVIAPTNDVGVLSGRSGERLAITVVIGDSPAPPADRAKVMARIAAAATQ